VIKLVKANFETIAGNKYKTDIEIKGSANKIILDLALILMNIKSENDDIYLDILKSMEIINNSINDGIDVDKLQDMFVRQYLKTLKRCE
jgi:hypothetical protein